MRGDRRWRTGGLALLGPGLAAGALWACAATLPGPAPCSQRRPCPDDGVCVIGRCRDKGTMPVSTDATRMIFEPADLAYVTPGGVRGRDTIGEAVVLGERGVDRQVLLRFAVGWPEDRKLQRAVLVMDPLPRCARRPGRVRLEIAQVTSPWRSAELTTARRPDLSLPMHAGDIPVTPPSPLRLDVTELVRDWKRHRKRYHGLALQGVGDSLSGACFSSGIGWGRGPRLELYLWPEERGEGGGGGAGGAGDGGAGGAEGGGGLGGEGQGGGGGGA